ncbi:MAG: holo-ACP synthase [Verrucomicrobiota bacterium]
MLGVGTDIVEVERIRLSHERHGERFLNRIYTPEEQAYCLDMSNPYPHLAARFAAKEAASKAFTTGIGKALGWKSVGIIHGERMQPLAVLDVQAQALLDALGGTHLLVSLSHTKAMAHAVALVLRRVSEKP